MPDKKKPSPLQARMKKTKIKFKSDAEIDAPETSKRKRDPGQAYSQQAKKFLTDMVLKQEDR